MMNFADMRSKGEPITTPTGRVVTAEPAVQGIPVRTDEGRRIRESLTGAIPFFKSFERALNNVHQGGVRDPLSAVFADLSQGPAEERS